MFFCFSIFEAVWRSRNLERVYIFSTKAILRPPCRRYGGDPVTKKIDNPKILDTYFQRFSIFEAVWRSRNLECLYIGIYIYIIIRANSRLPCRRYRDGSSTKKIDIPKILDTWFFVFRYFQPFGYHATSNFSIYRYIYIITVILRPNCRR